MDPRKLRKARAQRGWQVDDPVTSPGTDQVGLQKRLVVTCIFLLKKSLLHFKRGAPIARSPRFCAT
jgi:hypothetical protein